SMTRCQLPVDLYRSATDHIHKYGFGERVFLYLLHGVFNGYSHLIRSACIEFHLRKIFILGIDKHCSVRWLGFDELPRFYKEMIIFIHSFTVRIVMQYKVLPDPEKNDQCKGYNRISFACPDKCSRYKNNWECHF